MPKTLEAALQPSRFLVPFNTGVAITPGQCAQITAKARRGYRPERFLISGHPKEWTVHALHINGHPVWNKEVDVPGTEFSVSCLWTPFVNQFVKRGQPVVLLVSYVGRLKKGRAFTGVIVGNTKPRARRTRRARPT